MVLKMNWHDVIGHEDVIAELKTIMRQGRMPHAVLFIGSEGIGKQLVARIMAASLFCEKQNGTPCGECFSCRQFFSNQHPDFFSLSPEGNSIKIEQIRQLQGEISLSPYLADKRIVIIDKAELMTVQSANSLLKTLEEPQGDVIFILLAHSRQSLLDTILSRCQVFNFQPLKVSVLAQALLSKDIDKDKVDILARLSDGSIGKALELWEKNGLQLRKQAIEVLDCIDLDDIWRVSTALSELERNRLLEVLEYLSMLWRDMLVLHEECNGELIYNIDMKEILNNKSDAWSTRRLLAALQLLSKVRMSLKSNANARLAMESFLLKLRDL